MKASAEGWKSYLADPAPANALIKKDNPNMTDDQLAYSVAKLKEMGMVAGGDAATQGIGIMTDARTEGELRLPRVGQAAGPGEGRAAKTYTTEFVKDIKVLP